MAYDVSRMQSNGKTSLSGDDDNFRLHLRSHWNDLERFLSAWGEKQDALLNHGAATLGTEIHDVDIRFLPDGELPNNVQSTEAATFSCQDASETAAGPASLALQPQGRPQDDASRVWSASRLPVLQSMHNVFTDNFLQFKRRRSPGLIRDIAEHRYFEVVVALVITANAVVIGMGADYALANPHDPSNSTLEALEMICVVFYCLEVCLRFMHQGRGYFTQHIHARWNLFDLFLILQGVLEQVEKIYIATNRSERNLKQLSFLRTLRLFRMLKLLRMIRLVRLFRELRLMLISIFGCVRSMMWSCLLIFTIAYMFSICFMQGCSQYLDQGARDINPQTRAGIEKYWGSIWLSISSLYIGTMSGEDWVFMAKPLQEVNLILYLAFLLYIATFYFVIVNTINSVFIESMITSSDRDQQLTIEMHLEKKDDYIDNLQVFFDETDKDGDGQITFEEFVQHAETPQMQAFADSLEIDILEASKFFNILSDNGRRSVDVETFVIGCIKLKGSARAMDLMDLYNSHRQSAMELKAFSKSILAALQEVKSQLINSRTELCPNVLSISKLRPPPTPPTKVSL